MGKKVTWQQFNTTSSWQRTDEEASGSLRSGTARSCFLKSNFFISLNLNLPKWIIWLLHISVQDIWALTYYTSFSCLFSTLCLIISLIFTFIICTLCIFKNETLLNCFMNIIWLEAYRLHFELCNVINIL